LHLCIFDQPGKNNFFKNLLEQVRQRPQHHLQHEGRESRHE
jgi:hypothetical protein